MIFIDTMKVYYQANNRKFLERDVTIDFESQNRFYGYKGELPHTYFETVTRSGTDTLPLAIKWSVAQRKNQLVSREKEKMMQEVIITTKAKNATKELDKLLSSSLFTTSDAMLFDFVNEDQSAAFGYNNILEWLQGRVPGFTTSTVDGVVIPYLRQSIAQLYLDEIAVEPDIMNSIPVTDIAMIKVIRGTFVGNRGSASGAIAIYTRRGNMPSRSTASSMPTNILVGYSKVPPPFSPDYSDDINKNNPDEREILFWSQLFHLSGNTNKAIIQFYNSDKAKEFRLIVTGFASDGRILYADRNIR